MWFKFPFHNKKNVIYVPEVFGQYTNHFISNLLKQWPHVKLILINCALNIFSVEVFDKDKLGKDKSLGQIEVDPRDFANGEAKWFPLQVI